VGQPGVDDGVESLSVHGPHDLRLFFRVVIPGFRRGQRMSIIVPPRKTMMCSSGAQPSPSRTSLLRLMRFISLTVPSEKSDWCPQSHTNDDGKSSRGIMHLDRDDGHSETDVRQPGLQGDSTEMPERLPDAVPR